VSPAAPLLDRLSALEAQLVQFAARQRELERENQQLQQERDEYRKLVVHLREENERLKRGLLGQKAERLPAPDAQLSLALLGLSLSGAAAQKPGPSEAEEPAVELQVIPEHLRPKPVRKPLPETLPRVVIELVPPEVQREGTCAFECIGSDVREVLERRPASTVVVQLVYKKFVRKERDRLAQTEVLTPETVELPIERGTAGPGMLADTLVRRFQDHQPLHRLEGIYGREGLSLCRSTLCTWHGQLADLCRPLVEVMFEEAYQAPSLCADATGVLVLDKERCRQGHFWVLVVPERHVLYRYSRRHDKPAVDALLPNYVGYLVVDAHTVYDHLFVEGRVIEVGCWAHCRRYFFKALGSDPDRARVALGHIGALFRIERSIATAPRKKREQVRRDKSRPGCDVFFQFCLLERDRVLSESPLADAIRYALNQRQALERFLADGRLPLHTNLSELHLRRQAVGRKNWLFCGSDDGAEVNTVFVSLLASCQMHRIEPFGYLRDLLCLLPRWPKSRLLDLAPVNWTYTQNEPQTQQLLADNVFRRAILGLSS
jgi:transposase